MVAWHGVAWRETDLHGGNGRSQLYKSRWQRTAAGGGFMMIRNPRLLLVS
jgi:hypothetical protein